MYNQTLLFTAICPLFVCLPQDDYADHLLLFLKHNYWSCLYNRGHTETKNTKIHHRHKTTTQPNIVVVIPNIIIPIRITRASISTIVPIAAVFYTITPSRFHCLHPVLHHSLNFTQMQHCYFMLIVAYEFSVWMNQKPQIEPQHRQSGIC